MLRRSLPSSARHQATAPACRRLSVDGERQTRQRHFPVALSPRERFVEFLQSRGMRVTQQRLALVQHVFSRHEHFDADQLMEQLPTSGQPGHVSRPTVYRTLGEFVDAGLLRKFVLNDRADANVSSMNWK